MNDDKIVKQKALLRQRFRLLRDQFPDKTLASKKIFQSVAELPKFINAKSIIFYASKDQEVSTNELIDLALSLGKKVYLPFVKKLTVGKIGCRQELILGAKGILEPTKELPLKELKIFNPDLIILPGIAFDLKHHRLGSGAGWYDRFFLTQKKKLFKIGLAFDIQITSFLPNDVFDIPAEMVITEKRLF